jgi:hypothetical protein
MAKPAGYKSPPVSGCSEWRMIARFPAGGKLNQTGTLLAETLTFRFSPADAADRVYGESKKCQRKKKTYGSPQSKLRRHKLRLNPLPGGD